MTQRPGRLLLALGLMVVLTAAAGAQELYLSGTVVLAGKDDTFGSIGVMTGGADATKLATLFTTTLPKLSDHPALIPARDLRNKLPAGIAENLVLVGGPIVYLPASVATQQEQKFYTALLQAIERALPGRSLRVEVWATNGQTPRLDHIDGPLEFQFPSGDGSAQALVRNSFVQYKGHGDATFSYLPVQIRVEALVPVAKRSIPYGTTFPASEVEFESVDISSLTGNPASISANTLEARTNISQGQVIYSDAVGKVQAISSGKEIRIAFRKGSVEVTVPGSAYDSGAIGDTISVGTLSSGRRFDGRIVSATEVIVEN